MNPANNNPHFTGALMDTRTPYEKSFDVNFDEIVAGLAPVIWEEKQPSQWRRYLIRNQDGSGSCVAQTIAKMAGIHHQNNHGEYVEFSASFIYNKRSNAPGAGMIGVNAFDIWNKFGIVPEVMMPSQNMSDSQMAAVSQDTADVLVGEVFRSGSLVVLPSKSHERVASVIQHTGKPVMVWFRSDYSSWSKNYPTIPGSGSAWEVHHSVTAVDYCLINGKKHIIIEDSWGSTGIDGSGQRAIAVEVFDALNTFAAYVMNFKYDDREEKPDQTKPKYNFKKDIEYGVMGNADVVALQKILKYEGLFPVNIEATGNYLGKTAEAVVLYQKKYKLSPDWYIDQYLSGNKSRVGPKTREHLNSKYSV